MNTVLWVGQEVSSPNFARLRHSSREGARRLLVRPGTCLMKEALLVPHLCRSSTERGTREHFPALSSALRFWAGTFRSTLFFGTFQVKALALQRLLQVAATIVNLETHYIGEPLKFDGPKDHQY